MKLSDAVLGNTVNSSSSLLPRGKGEGRGERGREAATLGMAGQRRGKEPSLSAGGRQWFGLGEGLVLNLRR